MSKGSNTWSKVELRTFRDQIFEILDRFGRCRNLEDLWNGTKLTYNSKKSNSEAQRSSSCYFGDWFSRVCGSGWDFGACNIVDVCSARFAPQRERRKPLRAFRWAKVFRIWSVMLCVVGCVVWVVFFWGRVGPTWVQKQAERMIWWTFFGLFWPRGGKRYSKINKYMNK